ncbi:MAG: DUF3800 domain-containing protein [Desulfobacteraceae bacterium]|nr:MAG: DUF3800 domain-containing protein [Desulfobacteraceae bacterium]
MNTTFNIYCDESCHLENDHLQVMVLGAVWCPLDKVREISLRLREIKSKHRRKPTFETKWTKVSPGGKALYLDLLDYFFDDDDLHFRALIVPDKSLLRHTDHDQDHDTWYYKMYFDMLKIILNPESKYRIYLDIKDTRSASKRDKLHAVLCNNILDFNRKIIERVQAVRSEEVEILQLADLLIGAISYCNRGLADNAGKVALVQRMQLRSGLSLTYTTLPLAAKVNLFKWHASWRSV